MWSPFKHRPNRASKWSPFLTSLKSTTSFGQRCTEPVWTPNLKLGKEIQTNRTLLCVQICKGAGRKMMFLCFLFMSKKASVIRFFPWASKKSKKEGVELKFINHKTTYCSQIFRGATHPCKNVLLNLHYTRLKTRSSLFCFLSSDNRVLRDIQFSQGDCLFDIFMGVVVHDKKIESSLLGASQV